MSAAVCVFVKNEARDLAEWIAYHFAIGFTAVIVLDNLSTDGTWTAVEDCKRMGPVLMHSWSLDSSFQQMAGYEYVCKAYGAVFDWIAFIDSDEFIASADRKPIQALLNTCDDASAIALNWLTFGSSGYVHPPKGLVIDSFTRRSEAWFSANRHCKSIVRPRYVRASCNPHGFEVDGRYVDLTGRDITWTQIGITDEPPVNLAWRVHHYFTRSMTHWLEKLKRGYGPDGAVRTMADFAKYDRNEVRDFAAAQWGDDVRQLLSRERPG